MRWESGPDALPFDIDADEAREAAVDDIAVDGRDEVLPLLRRARGGE